MSEVAWVEDESSMLSLLRIEVIYIHIYYYRVCMLHVLIDKPSAKALLSYFSYTFIFIDFQVSS